LVLLKGKEGKMNEEFKDENPSVPPASAEADVVVLIKRMQQQLIFLEKKIDILISQSQAAPSGEKHFSRPYRSFDRPQRYGNRDRDRGSADRGPAQERHFEKRHSEENRGFGSKRSYDNPRGSDSGPERHFEKRHGGENRGFGQKIGQKKRPFFPKRRDRG
jgi:hypothetical protein